ncbi:MAG: ImmA/IrrE family metallo-endopeptidase [Marvinbryantia sp.]|uniref:ImmA/IrrE family metallo-endopeptidase n=1 Tax=Marvinbryantia sp. TaxID=2496532 RepID=UPI003999C04F
MTYEDLLLEADSEKLIVREKNIPGYNGRIYKNRIAINKDIKTSTEKACVLAEELGHYYTTAGDILDQSDAGNRKQEFRARLHGYNRMVGLMGIIRSYEHGCRNLYETAEYLEVTEAFLQEALSAYRSKYGIYKELDNYVIFFEPQLAVLKKFED